MKIENNGRDSLKKVKHLKIFIKRKGGELQNNKNQLEEMTTERILEMRQTQTTMKLKKTQ